MNGSYTKIVNGIVIERRALGLGDRIERAIGKIPGVTSLPCHDQQTKQLKPESPCGKAKARLNDGERVIPTIIKRIKGE